MAAHLSTTQEASPHMSVHHRVEHAAAQGEVEEFKAAAYGRVAGGRVAGTVEENLWVCPID